MSRYICIHGHFYQPPRENAWLEGVELQDSAYPYHDWNERITAEGYAPNTAARILGPENRIIDIINNYSKISFNFGPTLLAWMEREKPNVYQAIIEADKASQDNFSGHGAAIAQVYNHMIMPLAKDRDKRTQVLWGLRDFEFRFGRKPEGMWLPETAVDLKSLEILVEYGIKFTILAPSQAAQVRRMGEKKWQDVSGSKIDPKAPYLCHLPSGKTITLFFYDGPVSQELGFGALLNNGEAFASRLLGAFSDTPDRTELVHIATDGETYGHHKPHGDMALAYCLHHIEANDLAKLTIYSEFLEQNPPAHEVKIFENSSWSCVHGIERWRSDCGCSMGRTEWHQAWRAPLREALDWLRAELKPIYQKEMETLGVDPWQMRDEYIRVILDRSEENVRDFFAEYVPGKLSEEEEIRMLRLLEMQRHAMLMYTSCGWFFDEISGIETTQVLQYAARAIQLAETVSETKLEAEFLKRLAEAPSNISEHQNGARIYEKFIKPGQIDLLRVGAHYAVSSLFTDYPESVRIYGYTANNESYETLRAGKLKLGIGRARVRSDITWHETEISFSVLHLGGHIINGGVREFMNEDEFSRMHEEIKTEFLSSDIPEVIRVMDEHFGTHSYTLWHLFKDEQRKVFDQILRRSMEAIEFHYRQIYEGDYTVMQAMHQMEVPLPNSLATPIVFILNTDLRKNLQSDEVDLEELTQLIAEFKKWQLTPDKPILNYVASNKINALLQELAEDATNVDRIMTIQEIMHLLKELTLEPDIWVAQNTYFIIWKKNFGEMFEKAEGGDEGAKAWLEQFSRLGEHLNVKING